MKAFCIIMAIVNSVQATAIVFFHYIPSSQAVAVAAFLGASMGWFAIGKQP